MKIDVNSPLNDRKEILISAPVGKVWSELVDIDRWSEWQPDVTSSKLDGELAVGGVFHWKSKGLSITSTIQMVEPMQSIGWTGKSFGMQAIHIWTFETYKEGTHVTTEESLTGWVPRIMKLFDPKFLEKSMLNSLQVLKSHVEGT